MIFLFFTLRAVRDITLYLLLCIIICLPLKKKNQFRATTYNARCYNNNSDDNNNNNNTTMIMDICMLTKESYGSSIDYLIIIVLTAFKPTEMFCHFLFSANILFFA